MPARGAALVVLHNWRLLCCGGHGGTRYVHRGGRCVAGEISWWERCAKREAFAGDSHSGGLVHLVAMDLLLRSQSGWLRFPAPWCIGSCTGGWAPADRGTRSELATPRAWKPALHGGLRLCGESTAMGSAKHEITPTPGSPPWRATSANAEAGWVVWVTNVICLRLGSSCGKDTPD